MLGYVVISSLTYILFLVALKNRVGMLSPTGLFGFTTFLMAIGTFVQIDSSNAVESKYADIILFCTLAYLSTSMFMVQATKGRVAAIRVRTHVPGLPLYALLALSIAIVVLYFRAVGYSAFLSGLRDLGSGSSLDVGGLRLESYSGSRYLFPGYVNQFKNALLPGLTIVVALHLRHRPGPRLVVLPPLILFTIFALVGTGQRGAFVIAVVMLTCFMSMWARGREISARTIALGLGSIVAVLTLTTVALARNATLAVDAGWAQRTSTSLVDFGERVLLINQRSGIEGFRYTESIPKPGFGSEWVQSLLGILPGSRGSDLARQIFAMRYGSSRGTSPPSLWGSVYYNFGAVGVVVAPLLLAWICATVSSAAVRRQHKNVLEAVGVAGVTASLGMWVADSPLYLLNSGLVTYAALWWAGAKHSGDKSSEDHALERGEPQAPVTAPRHRRNRRPLRSATAPATEEPVKVTA